jgi:hypothetical protein
MSEANAANEHFSVFHIVMLFVLQRFLQLEVYMTPDVSSAIRKLYVGDVDIVVRAEEARSSERDLEKDSE